MADKNAFGLGPLDSVIADFESQLGATPGIGLGSAQDTPQRTPDIDVRRPTKAPSAARGLLPPVNWVPIFESVSQKYDVPVNVLMALAQQESNYNPNARGQPTQYGRALGPMQYLSSTAKMLGINPFDTEQSIDAAARQLKERLDKGYSMEDAVREHFAGPDRRGWGPKTAQYGIDVLNKARQIGTQMYGETPEPQAMPDMRRNPFLTQGNMSTRQDGPMSVPAGTDTRELAQPSMDAPEEAAAQDATFMDDVADVGRNLKIGANIAAQDFRELATKVLPKGLVDAIDSVDTYLSGKSSEELLKADTKSMTEAMTPQMREAMKKDWWDADEGKFGSAWTDWRSYASGVLQSAPEMVITMAPGLVLARGVYAARIAAGASKEAAAKAAARAAMFSGAATEGVLGGAQSSRQVRDEIMALPPAVLQKSDAYNTLLSQGMDAAQARKTLAEDAASRAFVTGGVATGIFGGLGDRAIAKIITGGQSGNIAKRILGGFVKGTVGEGLFEELPQSAFQQLAQNEAVRKANPDKALSDDVVNQALGGLAVGAAQGGMMGGAGGAISRGDSVQTSTSGNVTTNIPRPASGPLGRAVQAGEADAAARRVVVATPDGNTFTGFLDAYDDDGQGGFVARVISDEGLPLNVSSADGVTITPEAQFQAAQQQAAGDVIDPTTGEVLSEAQPEGATVTESEATDAKPTDSVPVRDGGEPGAAPAGNERGSQPGKSKADEAGATPAGQDAVTETGRSGTEGVAGATGPRDTKRPLRRDLSALPLDELVKHREYLSSQARTNGGWDKTLTREKSRVEAAIRKIDPAALDQFKTAAERKAAEQAPQASPSSTSTAAPTPRETDITTPEGKPLVELFHPTNGTHVLVRKDQWESGKERLVIFNRGGTRKVGPGQEVNRTALAAPIEATPSVVPDRSISQQATPELNVTPAQKDSEPEATGNVIDDLISLEQDAGQGLKSNDRAIAILEHTKDGLTPAAKAKVTRTINKHTSIEPDGTRIIKGPEFYESIAENFGQIEHMLRDAMEAVTHETKSAAPAPTKPKTASKEDLDHLFGVDQKREKALERIAKGRAWFSDQKKARDFITKNGLADTHAVEQTGAKRFEVKTKAVGEPTLEAGQQVVAVSKRSGDVVDRGVYRGDDPRTGSAKIETAPGSISMRHQDNYEIQPVQQTATGDDAGARAATTPPAPADDAAPEHAAQKKPVTVTRTPSEFTFAIKPVENGYIIESDDGGGRVVAGRAKGFASVFGTPPRVFKRRNDAVKFMRDRDMVEASAEQPKPVTVSRTPGVTTIVIDPSAMSSPSVSLGSVATGAVLEAEDGTLYRVEGIDTKANRIRTTRNPNQTSERIALIDQDTFNRLVRETEAARYEAISAATKTASPDPVAPAEQEVAPEPKPADDRFSGNKIFTADKVAKARARLKSKLNQLNSGIDPEVMLDGIIITGAYLESGVRDFSAYAKEMIQDMGEAVKPYLLSFYEGARNYPGLDTKGMSSVEDAARQHAAMVEPADAQTEAVGEVAAKPARRKRKTGAKQDMTLTQDWGVDHIDGYNDTPDRETGNTVKDAFMKEARTYLNTVAGILTENGYTPHTDAKGRPMKPVSVNESGVAGSGDISLTLAGPNGVGVYVHIGYSALRGVVPTSPSGVAIMFRAAQNSDKFGVKGVNQWAPVDLSAADFAALVDSHIQREAKQNERPATTQDAGSGVQGSSAQGVPTNEEPGTTGDLFGQPDSRGNAVDLDRDRAGDTEPDADGRSDQARTAGGNGPQDRRGSSPVAGAGRTADGGNRGRERSPRADDAGRTDRGLLAREDGRPVSAPRNYRIQPGEITREGSWKDTAARNIEIVELVKRLDAENRQATPDEKAQLTKFTGWGASEIANGVFPDRHGNYKPGWKELGERLKAALTEQEYADARRSTQYAHYTSEGVIRSIYAGLDRLGFKGGEVAEPGMGIGLFAGLMPDVIAANSTYTGIEFDPITGAIAKHLYPASNIIVGDYTRTNLPANYFDAAIGNPPFSSTVITNDPEYKRHRFMLHDYFFAKTIDRVRPGGLVVFVTSKGTMDKASDKARKYLAQRANLVGAVRLPQTAFKGNAGTEVVTDVLFLQKKGAGVEDNGVSWLGLKEVKTNKGESTPVNEYFADHPDMVLGEHAMTGSMYRANEYTVEPRAGEDIEQAFAAAVTRLPEGIYNPERGTKADTARVIDRDYNPTNRKEGGLYLTEDGTLMQVDNGSGVPVSQRKGADGKKMIDLRPKQIEWLKDYVGLRDALKAAQHDQLTDGDWQSSMRTLNTVYDRFVKKHGPILAHTITERENEDGTTSVTQRFKNKQLWEMDAEGSLVFGLEGTHADGSITKGPIFTERVLRKPADPEIKTTQDAMFVSLNRLGRLDIEDVTKLAGLPRDEVIDTLGTAIYEDPGAGWQTADEYLSGNVVRKLEQARAAADLNAKFKRNVDALLAVQPRPLGPTDITVRLGANWVPATDIEAFAQEALGESIDVIYTPVTGDWAASGRGGVAGSEWAAGDMSASQILHAVLNSRQLKVTYRDGEGKTHTDPVETEKANDVARKMKEAFARWVWTDPARADRLTKYYNENFNNIAPRQYDGSHLTLPGVSMRFTLHPHQKRAVWRIIQDGDAYLAHAVGSGKTIEMIAGGMEQRRLGLISKPIYTVPNHMLAQFAGEFLELYPTAHIMVADEQNFHTTNRRRFIAQAALNNPDAIIITHSAFGRLGMSDEYANAFIQRQIEDWKAALNDVDNSDRITKKQIERRIEQLEKRLEGKQAKETKDRALTFEELGADYLFVDEMHEFRKLDFATNQGNIKGIDPAGSQRALDLFMKVEYLRGKRPGRSITGASGTPITNTMGELFTVQRFFQPEQLAEDGLDTFDAWAAQYGDTVTALEQNAAGGYETVTRFAKFQNVPELMRRVRSFMDIVTNTKLGELVKRPNVAGGSRQIVVTPSPSGYRDYQKTLEARIKAIRERKGPPEKGQDIILTVIADGRFSAMDMRFVDPTLPPDPDSKLNRMLDDLIEAYRNTADNEYTTDGVPDPLKGSTLLVFSDIGLGEQAAARRGFSMHDWIVTRLTDAGIPREHVAFMRDYKQHSKKGRLFADMREGKKRILIGGKDMETGVNVQKRLTHISHLDSPWFPSSVEQREGRGVRQGNQNAEVNVRSYATKGSYDSTMWSMNARKARFIEQAMNGDDSVRSLEDVSEASSFEMAAALASGDERYLKLAGLRGDVERLSRLRQAHYDGQNRMRQDRHWAESEVERKTKQLAEYKAAIAKRTPIVAGQFEGKIGKVTFDSREEFSNALFAAFKKLVGEQADKTEVIGKIGGFDINFDGVRGEKSYFASITVDVPGSESILDWPVTDGVAINGLATKAANQVNGLDRRATLAEQDISNAQRKIEQIDARFGAPFAEEADLLDKVAQLNDLEAELAAESKDADSAQVAEQAQAEPPSDISLSVTNQTETPAFKAWFGDSKVVDAEGKPLVMYHGTSKDGDFSRFKVSARGAWFTSDADVASEYADENDSKGLKYNPDTRRYDEVNSAARVMPVYLKIENPYRPTQDDAQRVNIGNYAKAQRELFAEIRAKGYDGILWNDNLNKEWVVLGGPEQIKSAIGNRGTFDPSNPNILFSAGGTRDAGQSNRAEDSTRIQPADAGRTGSPAQGHEGVQRLDKGQTGRAKSQQGIGGAFSVAVEGGTLGLSARGTDAMRAQRPIQIRSTAAQRNLPTEQLRERAFTALRDAKSLNNPQIGQIAINRAGWGKSRANSADRAKLLSLSALPEIMRDGAYLGSRPTTKERGVAYHYIGQRLAVDGVPLVALVTVQEHADGSLTYYNHTLLTDPFASGRSGGNVDSLLASYRRPAFTPDRQRSRAEALPITHERNHRALLDGALGGLVDTLIGSGHVVLHPNENALPASIRLKGGANVQGWTDRGTGIIHLVAENLTPQTAQPVLMHEALHGHGEQLLGTPKWNRLMRRGEALRRAAERRRADGRVQDGGFWDGALRRLDAAQAAGAVSQERLNEEFAAYAIEEYELAPSGVRKWVDALIGMVKDWLFRRFGIQAGQVTPAQLRAMALAALRSLDGTVPVQSRAMDGHAFGGMAMSAAPAVDTPAFKRWFGDSVVVDENGDPMVVYHGTDAEFTAFDPAKRGSNTGWDNTNLGFFFIADRGRAEDFARDTSGGDRIIDAYLSIQKPIRLNNVDLFNNAEQAPTLTEIFSGERIDDPQEALESINDEIDLSNIGEITEALRDPQARAIMERDGYDGVISHFGAGELEYIAFRPEQIKSASSNLGTFDASNPDIMFSVTPDLKEATEALDTDTDYLDFEGLPDVSGSAIRDMTSRYMKYVAHPRHIAALHRDFVPVFKAANDQQHDRNATLEDLHKDFKAYDKLKQASKDRVNRILELGRLLGEVFSEAALYKGVTNPGYVRTVVRDENGEPHLVRQSFQAALSKAGDTIKLTAAEQDAYRGLRRMFDKALNKFRDQALADFGFAEYVGMDNPLDALRKLVDGKSNADANRIRNVIQFIEDIEQSKRAGYVPFSRYGDYVIAVKERVADLKYRKMGSGYLVRGVTPELDEVLDRIGAIYDSEEHEWYVSDEQRDELERANERTVYSEKIETGLRDKFGKNSESKVKRREAKVENIPSVKAAMARIEKEYGDGHIKRRVIGFETTKKRGEGGIDLTALDALAEVAQIDNPTWDAVRGELQKALQAGGFRRHFFQSSHVPGYTTDFQRAIADYMVGMSGYLARRRFSDAWDKALAAIKGSALHEYATKYRAYFNDPREEFAMLRQLAFVMKIGANISSALVNLSQTFLTTIPTLNQIAGRATVAAELARAAKDVLAMVTPKAGTNVFDMAKAPTDLREEYARADAAGLFLPLNSFDLMGQANQRSAAGRKTQKFANTATSVISLPFSASERFNRIIAFTVAARLAKRPGMAAKIRNHFKNDAWTRDSFGHGFTPYDFAEWLAQETQFQMGKINRPTMMRGAGAAMLQFKSFMMQLLEKMYRDWTLHGAAGKVSAISTLAMMIAFSGLMGAPGADDLRKLIEFLYKQATGKDADLKDAMRQTIYGATGSMLVTDALSSGIPYYFGVDLSQRVGLGNILPEQYNKTGFDTLDMITMVGGPGFDILVAAPIRAMGLASAGNIAGAVGELAPVWAKNPLQAYQWGTDAVRTKRGDKVLDRSEIDGVDIALKAIGVQPSRVSRQYEMSSAQYRSQRGSDDAKRALRLNLVRSIERRSNNEDAGREAEFDADVDAAVDKIREWNRNAAPDQRISLKPASVRKMLQRERQGGESVIQRAPRAAREGALRRAEAYGLGLGR